MAAKKQPTTNQQSVPVFNEQMRELVENAMIRSQEFVRTLLDPRRDIGNECGYPLNISREQYKLLYEREPIATRVVEVLPDESWCVQPEVYEEEDSDTATEFEDAWDTVGKSLRSGSLYQDEAGGPIWEILKRADKLSGIGSFGLVLLGLNDGKALSEPIGEVEKSVLTNNKDPMKPPKGRQLLFVRAFDEGLVDIIQCETNPKSVRYGQPVMYNVTLQDPSVGREQASFAQALGSVNVHWTRVIHIADNLGSSEFLGVPRMQTVYNRLHDLYKMYGGSAEMYWRGAFPGYSIETHPQLGGDVDINVEGTKDQMEQWSNGLQRAMVLSGMSLKSISPQVVDPTPQIKTQIEAICIRLGIPVRIFMGSERGELASSQDERAWAKRMKKRQQEYITPRIIVPFVDRLIAMGVLPTPVGFSVAWPEDYALSEAEQADVAVKETQAIAQYVQSGAEAFITPLDFLTRILKKSDEEAQSIVDAAEEHALEMEEEQAAEQEQAALEQQALADEQGYQPAPPEGFVDPKQQKPAFGNGKPPAFGGKKNAAPKA